MVGAERGDVAVIDTQRHTMHCERDDIAVDDRAAARDALRARIQQKLAEATTRNQTVSSTYTPPRYDAVFFDGVAWLDTL